MASISNAVGSERVSRVVGYVLKAGSFQTVSPNLPQRIAVLGEANTANQATFPTIGTEIITLKEAGDKYGFGSPIYQSLRILNPISGDGVGGIPVIVHAQAEAGGAAAKELEITVTGTATAGGNHTVILAGRGAVDGESYTFAVVEGDTPTIIAATISDTINNVLVAPMTASSAIGVVTAISKWKGLTAEDLTITIDTGETSTGITYGVVSTVAGSGEPTVTAALDTFDDNWNTIVLNTYGVSATAIMTELEVFNGRPDPDTPTGRFAGIIMKPFIALTGTVNDDDTTLTDAKKDDLTIALCPAPLSPALPMEAAANMTVLFARVAQDTPHLDVNNKLYPDMPGPTGSILMSDYDVRDAFVKKGSSTVDVSSDRYRVQDFVTTYHPVGETPPQFRYSRNLMVDFNVRFGYFLLEEINVVDHVIANDEDIVTAANVIKPKQWISILGAYADDLSKRALIADPSFMKDSTLVALSSVNPDRLETSFKYKRTGIARISATDAEAGFNFGDL